MEMVLRRVYTDGGELIDERLTPDSIPNERGALLKWWADSDAAAASEAVAALIADEGPLPTDPALLALEDRLIQANDQLLVLNSRIRALEAIRLITPEAGVVLSQQIAAAAIAPQAIAGTLQAATDAITGTAAEAQARLDQLDEQVAVAVARLALLENSTTEAITSRAGALEAEFTRRLSDSLTLLAERAKDIKGDKGDTGRPGPGIGIGAGVPSGPEATVPVLGRLAIPGDTIVDASDELRIAYRWSGDGTWEAGPSMSGPVKVVPVSAVVSSVSSVSFDPTAKPPEISGGAESFAPLVIASNSGPVRIWDSSRWAAGDPRQTVHAALLYLEVISTTSGNRGSCLVNIVERGMGAAWDYSVYGELGSFGGDIQPDVEAVMAAVTPPAGTTLPAGLPMALHVSVGLTGAVGRYALQGWVLPSLEAAADGKQPKPGW